MLVQGAGAVGAMLARELADGGARVLVSRRRRGARGGNRLRDGRRRGRRCSTTECDVYSPCAVGGTLNARDDPAARAAASSPARRTTSSREPEDAERLHERGILYAPDYVVNAGGVIQLVGLEDDGWDEAELEESLARIGDTLRALFADADAAGITPADAAERLAAERIAQGRRNAQREPRATLTFIRKRLSGSYFALSAASRS